MTFEAERIISVHNELLSIHRIESGFRDLGTIYSICAKIDLQFAEDPVYNNPTLKAAVLFEGIIRLHPFIDGNKRTAIAVIQEFLMENNLIFVVPLTAVRFAVQIAKTNVLESEKIEDLTQNIEKWISYRTAQVTDIDKMRRLIDLDLRQLDTIKHLSRSNRKKNFVNKVLDYWLAKDIYPDSNIKFDELRKFHLERLERILLFLHETTN